MIDFAAARVLYADHIAENPEISPLMLQQPPTGRSVLDSGKLVQLLFHLEHNPTSIPSQQGRTAQI
jgi:hypothetical protein